MPLPDPQPGLVIRYLFLWREDYRKGRVEGDKEGRPALIVSVAPGLETGRRVAVLPITHTPPALAEESLEIPRAVAAHLGLDDGRSWIRLTEVNEFEWPGYDLRQVPGRPGQFAYGFLPPRLFRDVTERFRALGKTRRVAVVERGE